MKDPEKRAMLEQLPEGLSDRAKHLLLVLSLYLGRKDWVSPKNPNLMKKTKWPERKVQLALTDLKKAGLITIQYDGNNRWIYFTGMSPVTGLINREGVSPVTGKGVTGDVSLLYKGEGDKEGGSSSSFNKDSFNHTTEPTQGRSLEKKSSQASRGSQTPPPKPAAPSLGRTFNEVGATPSSPKRSPVSSWPERDEMGKNPENWKRLFNLMMQVMKQRGQIWGEPSCSTQLMKSFEELRARMLEAKWWPKKSELKAIRWRYSRPNFRPHDGVVGGHSIKSSANFFIVDFFEVASQCLAELEHYARIEARDHCVEELERPLEFLNRPPEEWTEGQFTVASNFNLTDPSVDYSKICFKREGRSAFLDLPIEEWTEDQLFLALRWHEATSDEVQVEFDRRNKLQFEVDEAEAKTLGITLEEYYKRKFDDESQF